MTQPTEPRAPDFLIIGAQRCGTTSLYEHLAHHPMVRHAKKKEVHYFDLQYWRGYEWYLRQLRRPRLRKKILTGEASPYYLFHPVVPDRVSETCPDVKLLVLLRDPVDRALSHYRHNVRMSYETLPTFERALASEGDRLTGQAEQLGDPRVVSFNHQNFSYRIRGVYVDQLTAWLERFPSNQLHVEFSDDLTTDTAATSERIQSFLGLAPRQLPLPHLNKSNESEEMDPATRDQLRAFYRPHDERLATLLQREVPWA